MRAKKKPARFAGLAECELYCCVNGIWTWVALCPYCPCSSPEEDSSRSGAPVAAIRVAAVAPPVSLLDAALAQCAFAAVALAPDAPEAERLRAGYREEVLSLVCCPEEVSSRAGCQAGLADAALAEEQLADGLTLPAW